MFFLVCVLVRCWVSGATWLFWLITHVVLCGVAGCVLVVLLWGLVVGVLCENCIVDASNLYSLIVLGVFVCYMCVVCEGHTVDAWAL